MRSNKTKAIFLGIGAAALLAVACMPDNEEAPSAAVPPTESVAVANTRPAAQGRQTVTKLYVEHCVNCHGANGEGGGAGTRTLISVEKFDQTHDQPFFDAIKSGVPDTAMPAYRDSLTDEQIWGLVVRIREFQGRALRAQSGSPKPDKGIYRSERHNFKIETVVEEGRGLSTPWGLDWLSDGLMIVTNRPGEVLLIDGSNVTEIAGVPNCLEAGQGGMLEVSVHPNYKENGWIYLAFSDPSADGSGSMTKVVRGKLKFDGQSASWTDEQTIFEVAQEFYTRAIHHYGSRIVFDGKGHIFFVVGERGTNELAQELTNPFGKIYRVNEDGTIPADNPFLDKAPSDKPYLKGIWSIGHRNPQGLAMNSKGELWDTEHGPRGGDELNRIEKGSNYGWPLVAWSINYNDMPQWSPWPKDGGLIVKQPTFRWLPSTGACGLDVMKGNRFPNWKGDLLAGGLVGQNLDRVRTDGDKLVEREELVHGLGRIREVAVGPDGNIYIALNQPDKIIRLVPMP
jgi:aldose sugar dehydrogenase